LAGEKGAAVSKRTLHGVYGDGSATIDVTTFSGGSSSEAIDRYG